MKKDNLLSNDKTAPIAVPLFAILIGLIVGALIMLCLGYNPLTAYLNLLQGCGLFPKPSYAGYKSILTDFTSFLNALTPMIFAALSVAVAYKAGLFNIGVSGQMVTAAFVATVLVGYSDLSAWIAKPLVLVIGIIVGALIGGLIGFLKYKFNINEVVSSIMLNYIAQYIISFFIKTRYVDPVSRQSKVISKASRWSMMNTEIGNLKIDLPLAFPIAVIAAIFVYFLLKKTRIGYEIKTVGASRTAAKYAGIKVGGTMVLSMVISGALAGLAGITYYMGYYGSIQPGTLPSMGFDAIAVCLLGNINPIGILFSSFMITAISKGSTYMSSTSGVQAEIVSVITGVILLFSACGAYIRYVAKRRKEDK